MLFGTRLIACTIYTHATTREETICTQYTMLYTQKDNTLHNLRYVYHIRRNPLYHHYEQRCTIAVNMCYIQRFFPLHVKSHRWLRTTTQHFYDRKKEERKKESLRIFVFSRVLLLLLADRKYFEGFFKMAMVHIRLAFWFCTKDRWSRGGCMQLRLGSLAKYLNVSTNIYFFAIVFQNQKVHTS